MQRDMDYVRELLLKIEALNEPNLLELLDVENEEHYQKLAFHIDMLVNQAYFVTGISANTMAGKNWLNLRLTWQGSDYLDAIRDPEIWSKTKSGAAAAGGFTIEILRDLAIGLVKHKIKQHTGIEI